MTHRPAGIFHRAGNPSVGGGAKEMCLPGLQPTGKNLGEHNGQSASDYNSVDHMVAGLLIYVNTVTLDLNSDLLYFFDLNMLKEKCK